MKTDLERFVELYTSWGISCPIQPETQYHEYIVVPEKDGVPLGFAVVFTDAGDFWEIFMCLKKEPVEAFNVMIKTTEGTCRE